MARETLRTAPRPGGSRPTAGRPPSAGTGAGTWVKRIASYAAAVAIGAGLYAGAQAITDQPSSTEQTVADLQAAEIVRDKQQVVALTGLAREVRERILPVVEGFAAAVPAAEGAPAAAPVTAAQVSAWRRSVDAAAAAFEDTSSAGTAVNVARGGLSNAVEQLAVAVATYETALVVDGDEQRRLLELAGDQRTAAVVGWSVGATQLDYINVESGAGHAHVTLPSTAGTGAFTADGTPEGTG